MQVIGYYYLSDRGGFNVNPEVIYVNQDGQGGTTNSYGERMAGQSIKFSPGDKPEVQNDAIVRLKVSVVLGKDREAKEAFIYQQGNPATANYEISGVAWNPKLKFLGITNSLEESEKLAAESVVEESEVEETNS